MKRKLMAIITILALVIQLMGMTAYADNALTPISGALLNDQLSFKLDGSAVIPVGDDGTPVLPISYNGTTYLPVKAIGYLLGLGIGYDGATKTVLITSVSNVPMPAVVATPKTNTLIPIKNVLLNGQLKFKLNGTSVIPVGDDGTAVLPISYNGTTYLPIKAIGYLLGLGIGYDIPTKTVLITKSGSTQPAPQPTTQPATQPTTTPTSQGAGWYFVKYTLTDGTGTYGSDKSSFTGEKNNMTMSHTRYDSKGNVVASSTHQTIWTDPPAFLKVGDLVSIQYETKQISSATWNMGSVAQQTVSMDQGMTVYFSAADGTKYITKAFNGLLTAEKPIEKGKAGAIRTIKLVIGRNYSVMYTYEWKD